MEEKKRRTFQEAMEDHYREVIDSLRDENGVVQSPKFVSCPALTCEERDLNRRVTHPGNETIQ